MTTIILAAALIAATNRAEVVELPTVIVEAGRLGQTKIETAAHVDVINKSDIDASGAQTTVELLEKRGNLFLRNLNGNPALSQVSMRGYGANSFGRVKIIVDGEELNNPDMAAQDLLRVPIRSIDRVEILHGPQTVLQGGNASGGVINIITNPNSYERKTTLEVHGGNFGKVGVYAATSGGFEEDGLTYFADFGFDRADGWRQNSWTESYSAQGGIRQNFENDSWIALKMFYAETSYGLPGSLFSNGSDWYGTYHKPWKHDPTDSDTPKDKARNDVYGVTLSTEVLFDEANTLNASFSFRNRRAVSKYVSYGSENESDLYAFAWKLQYTNLSAPFGFDNRLDLGTDHSLDILNVRSGNKNDYSRYSAALFARDEFFMTDELSVFGGARGEWFRTRNVFSSSYLNATDASTRGEAAGEIGVNWRPIEDVKLFAKWTRFYHAPLADEMFSYYGSPNLSLAPESGHNVEVGIDWTFAKDFNFNFTAYHTELEDEIMYLYGGNMNAPDTTARDGIETSLTWSRDKVGGAGILYTLVHSRFTAGDYRGKELPMVPRQHLRVFGEIYLVDWLSVNGGFRFVDRQRLDSDFAGETKELPSFGVFDLGVRVKPTCGFLEDFTFAFTIDNLFDKRYADYGVYNGPWAANAYYPACARSFLFTVRYEF